MMQIDLTDKEIAEIRQALYLAHCTSVSHRRTYAMFCDKVEESNNKSIKEEVQA
jgi:hypothetical protein